MKKQRLIMLCDYGLDDAIATAYILNNYDKFEEIHILAVAGNVPASVSMNNAKRLLSRFPDKRVTLVSTEKIPQPCEFLKDIHGKDGMGSVLPEENPDMPETDYDTWLAGLAGEYTVLSLGPCTVTEMLIPKITVGALVFMCGNIDEKPNYMGYEFNHGVNPDSFARCLKYPHASATLDTCHCPKWDFYTNGVVGAGLLADFIARYKQMCAERKDEYASAYDLVAAYYLLNPEDYTTVLRTDKDGNRINVLVYTGENPLL